jgi:hypothetical protein
MPTLSRSGRVRGATLGMSMLKGATFVLLVLLAARPWTGLACELACATQAGGAPETVACHGTHDVADRLSMQGVPAHCTHECGPVATERVLPRVFSADSIFAPALSLCAAAHPAVADLAARSGGPPGSTRAISPPSVRSVLRI